MHGSPRPVTITANRLVIFGPDGELETVAILKNEIDSPWGIAGKVLKVCTFKVAAEAGGAKRGELVLKAIFHYAHEKDVDSVYVEVFPAHEGVVRLFGGHGFHEREVVTKRGERVMVKSRRPPADISEWDSLTFHKDFGPPAVLIRGRVRRPHPAQVARRPLPGESHRGPALRP